MERKILLLGNPALYETSRPVTDADWKDLPAIVADLHDTLLAFRKKYGAGRAIAAPQIGVPLRLLYMFIDTPTVFINPSLEFPDEEMMDVIDDCMSFPELLVLVTRHRRCIIHYTDLEKNSCQMSLEGDLSELLQHEYDHLDGILAVMRAKNSKSFFLKSEV